MRNEQTWAEWVLAEYDRQTSLTSEMDRAGSFMSDLASALWSADSVNKMRILTTWQDKLEPLYPMVEHRQAVNPFPKLDINVETAI